VPIEVPPLRERRGDFPQLVGALRRRAHTRGLAPKEIEQAAVQRLTAHDWPGNIRELRRRERC